MQLETLIHPIPPLEYMRFRSPSLHLVLLLFQWRDCQNLTDHARCLSNYRMILEYTNPQVQQTSLVLSFGMHSHHSKIRVHWGKPNTCRLSRVNLPLSLRPVNTCQQRNLCTQMHLSWTMFPMRIPSTCYSRRVNWPPSLGPLKMYQQRTWCRLMDHLNSNDQLDRHGNCCPH